MDSILAIREGIKKRIRTRRKAFKFSQLELALRSGMSLGSLKRFESMGEISLTSLLKIAIALECEQDFQELFARKYYKSLQELMNKTK